MDRFKVKTRMELTVKEYAERERVTPRTVYNWIEKGALTEYRKTLGGKIRIKVEYFDAKEIESLGNSSD